eukprot:CAMPEP_0202042944 /NCGR_PEP_ID=MMETSP0962-20130828/28844_1 /ASSEMBLY_ACC=CAM_ASM_000488 /TAXON_ID=4773 /ORGANISM="Schizochytrium aggregatum, Strain ATCC28209" /LENGTH=118 /DNA_ID=CAMNT_0048607385 /DNA_START=243 /DNA_END=599 /DNA_ORIENTATION=-
MPARVARYHATGASGHALGVSEHQALGGCLIRPGRAGQCLAGVDDGHVRYARAVVKVMHEAGGNPRDGSSQDGYDVAHGRRAVRRATVAEVRSGGQTVVVVANAVHARLARLAFACRD